MRIRYGWELALAALLVIEIVSFGAINPRMLDLNMLLFSTSDFICIGIVALPLTMVIVSGGIDISFGSTIGLCAIALGVYECAGRRAYCIYSQTGWRGIFYQRWQRRTTSG